MTAAFQLHHSLARNARAHTAHAVSLDEAKKGSEALAAYDKAAELLTSYLHSFSPGALAFSKLAPAEQRLVAQTKASLSKHLQSVEDRRSVLRSSSGAVAGSSSARPSTVDRNDPLVKAIESEILDSGTKVQWDDIYGLEDAKKALHEMVVLPTLRPDLYSGLRAPGKGILLFGPPGTGKTLIAKAVATNANATFFSISASSLNSKFHGESEKLVRTLFQVARHKQPSFVFIDEVDSILGARSENEHEASRRLKTEFMAQFDGAMGGSTEDKVYVMAASNRPQDLDDAVRRRLDRRIYVPLPDVSGRKEFLSKVTTRNRDVRWNLSAANLEAIARKTTNFSGSDMKALCREASLMPLRELGSRVSNIKVNEVRACGVNDFEQALRIVRPSSNKSQIQELEAWNTQFGSQSKKPIVKAQKPQAQSSARTQDLASGGSSTVVRSSTAVTKRQPSYTIKRSTTSTSDMLSMLLFGGKRR
ncbi:unnamed protein product [Chondrus crispus]|uniref:microtubule-severing ATPase n=1 Tax=Chondrus crispus TaxID=2769 RepID=R7QFU4_CHOCR|nr:unnamed protein product [Chondrus crispus]CDF36295.1 unnamed protein product [Chondrus crispus]|eukprot:XP_005716114.1 unnamed protein product [Chondrus crispus]